MEQAKRIITLDLSNFPFLVLHRDLFLFEVLTGLTYNDLINLSWSNLDLRVDGNYKLTINRVKTDVITESFLPRQAIDVAMKYQNLLKEEISRRVLPYSTNQNFNRQLKLLAQLAGINIRLTSHIARHTFRQLLAETEIFNMAIIKRMMGHTNSREIDDIYYLLTEKGLLDAKNKFERFLSQNL